MTRYWFTIIDGHDQDSTLEIKPGLTLLGRSENRRDEDPPGSSRLTIEDGAVSRTHCQVEWEVGSPPVFTHLSGTNESLINGEAVVECTLKGGETIEIGSTVLSFSHHSNDWVASAEEGAWEPR